MPEVINLEVLLWQPAFQAFSPSLLSTVSQEKNGKSRQALRKESRTGCSSMHLF